jgi:Putative MetA-pathway of phenol degradation
MVDGHDGSGGADMFRRCILLLVLLIFASGEVGCVSTLSTSRPASAGSSIAKSGENEQSAQRAEPEDIGEATSASAKEARSGKKAPATLLAWQVGGNAGENQPADQDRQGGQVDTTPEDSPIKTDRPTFTPSSSTVGKNVIQLETGYQFTHSREEGVTMSSHSYPEANLRFGILADWLEGRIGQNFASTSTAGPNSHTSQTGADDLLLGVRLGLTKQKECLPETSVILQMSVPSGSPFLTRNQVLPGIIAIFGWDVIKNRLSVSGSLSANRALDDADHFYSLLAQSLVLNWSLTKKLDAFTEWYALTPSGAIGPATGPQPFFDTGMTFKVTPNMQLDGRAGLGLNHHADEFFTGVGLSVRY